MREGFDFMNINTNDYELISFDIFDTLLFRAVTQPVDIFKYTWDKARKKEICLTDISSTEFMKLRIEIERSARNKAINREVNLNEIYLEMPEFIVSDIECLKKLEIETEAELCYPNFDMLDLLKELNISGKIMVLLSDMYLSTSQIITILKLNSINITYFKHILISNELKCSKQNGDLFYELLRLYPHIRKEKILHIGDNKNSDYTQALRTGIHAFHYDVIPDKLYSIYDYEKIRYDIPQRELLSLRKVASISDYRTVKERTAYEIGASIIGPFLTLYIEWVCRRLEKLGIDRIYPLMREGYLLGELLKREAADRGQKLIVKPIYVSRKVTYIPSVDVVNREVIEDMIGARNLRIGEAISLIGFNVSDFAEIMDYMDIPFKESHKTSYGSITLKEYIITRFLEPANIISIETYIRKQRKLLNQYLKQEIGDFNHAATIDIGFFGRIQLWMEKSLDYDHISHSLKHFLAIGVVGEKLYAGVNYEGYYSTNSENSDLIPTIHRTTDILEKLISVTEGSTIGYEEINHTIVPVKSSGIDNKYYTDIIFEGIYSFQKHWFAFRTLKPELADHCLKNRRENLMILHRLIDLPRYTEAELLSSFEADTNFGTMYKKNIITEENISLLKQKGIDFIDKCNVSYTYENNNIVWPKGLITLFDEFYYLRKIIKNNSKNEIIRAMQDVVEEITLEGISEISLYGAGENGRQFYFVCSLYHVKVNCFIDRKESLWGSKKEGIEIMGLQDAIKKGYRTFLITSLFSISEIHDYIMDSFKNSKEKAIIFHV